MFLAALGIFRMPDTFTRMQAATKAATLGCGCLLLAVALHFGETAVTARALLVVIFLFLTAPVAAHVIARATYRAGVALWEHTVLDELARDRQIGGPDLARSGVEARPEPPPGGDEERKDGKS